MARVIWDGEKIVIDSSRLDKACLDSLSLKYGGEKLPFSDFYQFPRNKDIIKQIGALTGIVMDPSFQKLHFAVLTSEKKKETLIENRISELNLPERMYQFQKEAVLTMLDISNERNIMLASAPGCGKSCMTSVFLSKKENSYPCLLICPASLKVNWEVEIQKWSPGIRTYIVEGRDSYKIPAVIASAKEADVVIVNYDILGIDDKEAVEKEKERIERAKENGWKYRRAFIPVKGWAVVFSEEFEFKTIVCDECQYIESSKAIRSRAVIQVSSDKRIRKIFLSGTPFETKLRQFYNACHILAPDLFPKESDFLFRYCDPKKTYFGWTFDGVSNLDELRRKLSLFMIRHRKEDVLSQLPSKQKIPVYFDMSSSARKSYDEMEEKLISQKDQMHQFSYIAEMKKVLMEVKKDVVYQYIKDLLEVEDKVVVFVYHVKMFEYLQDRFRGINVGINGSTPSVKRQFMVDKFQKDNKIKLFIGQIGAASTGITLTASHTLVFTEFGQTAAQMEQASDRIHRIGQQSDVCQIYYLVLKDTIDEAPLKTLSSHYSDIDKVMNGGSDSEFVDFNSLITAWVNEKRLMKQKKSLSIEYR